MTRFKLFGAALSYVVEAEMNAWAASLPPGTKIIRVQLAAGGTGTIYALVSYEPAPDAGR